MRRHIDGGPAEAVFDVRRGALLEQIPHAARAAGRDGQEDWVFSSFRLQPRLPAGRKLRIEEIALCSVLSLLAIWGGCATMLPKTLAH